MHIPKLRRVTRRDFIEVFALAGAAYVAETAATSNVMPQSVGRVDIVVEGNMSHKIGHGIGRLTKALREIGVSYRLQGSQPEASSVGRVIRVRVNPSNFLAQAKRAEAFSIASHAHETLVEGFDDAGTLYALAQLATQIRQSGSLPERMDVTEVPKMTLRGTALFLMTAGTYIYPISKHEFPWLYEKALWTKTLDFLAEHRLNFISFWNAHPFPYFVRLEKYTGVKMVSNFDLAQNEELLQWLSAEAEKRNIWLMFQFYNIYIPESVAKAHGASKDTEFSRGYAVLHEPTPWAAEYTRYAIKEFIRKYPSLGLYVCLGEALQKDQSYWMNEVILAGVKDSGKHPPVILRNWALHDGLQILKNAAASYDNLHTEMKHNDEMYAVPEPDPANVEWINHSPGHIISVHLMGNLKPFRWAPPSLIQETARDQQEMGAKGVQIYPLWVWNWPYSADRQQLLQTDRDWLWYAAWGRYSWNSERRADQEREYWVGKIAERYGRDAADDILTAYEAAGRVMPSVPRMFWFDGWNHWFASNGLTLGQVLEGTPIPYTNIRKTVSVESYANNVAKGKPIKDDDLTPVALTRQMVMHGVQAVESVQKAGPLVTNSNEEFARLKTDFEATSLIAQIYEAKVNAAIQLVAYQLNPTPEVAAQVLVLFKRSVDCYRRLVAKTINAYAVANDIRNDIPFPFHPPSVPPDVNSIPHLPNWQDLLPVFEAEVALYGRLLH